METLRMSGRERQRFMLLGRVKRGELKLAKAAELLELRYRQVKRIWKRYQEQGDKGLVHGLRSRDSNRRVDGVRRERIVNLYREK